MAVKAAADVITSLIGDATISQLSSLIPDLLQVLSFAISSYDAELAVRIFGLFDDTTPARSRSCSRASARCWTPAAR